MAEFGDILEELRKDKGMTQKDLTINHLCNYWNHFKLRIRPIYAGFAKANYIS